ncbi:767_t:CDS:2, partial [Gigaspora margarita]
SKKDKQELIKHSILAYINDMIWIATRKLQLEELTNIESEFYEINDIHIIEKKFKLVILNSTH